MHSHIVKIVFLSVALLFVRCAQVVPLSGGNRDEEPPKLLEAVPMNSSTNFSVELVTLRFNEFITLKQITSELLVSPSLKNNPEIEADGKKVKIRLKKADLKPNTTYKIYFGNAIADMHEGNSLKGFEYVFSTGPNIDTLKMSGRISAAFENEDPGETVVGLYIKKDITNDSFVCKQRPDYVTRGGLKGDFKFSNLPDADYELVAFTDKNKNFTYEKDAEKIAFSSAPVHPLKDSFPQIRLFSEIPSKLFIKRSGVIYAGKVQVIYNKKSKFKVELLQKNETLLYQDRPELERDTLDLYYTSKSDSIQFSIKSLLQEKTDTVKMMLPRSKAFKAKSLVLDPNFDADVLERESPLILRSNTLLDEKKLDKSKFSWKYKKDTIQTKEALDLVLLDPLRLQVNNKLQEGINYTINADTAAVYDQAGRYNDSLKIDVKLRGKTELGHLILNMLFNLKQTYIVQLLGEGNKVALERSVSFSLSSSNTAKLDLEGVKPGTYSVKVIFDNNENKKWDTGDLIRKIQPENVFFSNKQIKVMPDWDVEEEIRVN
jgi:hypothetical protein